MATVAKHTTPLPDGDESFRDGLGVRYVVVDPASGDRVERLLLTPELARQAAAVEARTSRLVNFRHARFARLRGAEAGPGGEAVWVNAEPIEGIRWFDVLQVAEQGRVTIDVNTALQLAREILPALATLHDSRSVTHGALGPERLVLTPQARLTIVDHGLGAALAKLQYPRTRLWREFRLAVPPAAGVPRFDPRADVAMVAMTVLASLLGRAITRNEFPDHVRELLDKARERPPSGRDRQLSASLRAWLERTLPIESRRPLATALEAQVALEEAIKKERAYAPGASALKHFVERLGPLMGVATPQVAPASGSEPASRGESAPASNGRRALGSVPTAAPKRASRRPTPEEEEAEEIAFLEQELARLAAEEAARTQGGGEAGASQAPTVSELALVATPADAGAVPDAAAPQAAEDDPLALARLLDDLATSAETPPVAATDCAPVLELVVAGQPQPPPVPVTDSSNAGTSAARDDEALDGLALEAPAVTEILAEVPLRLADSPIVEFSEFGACETALDAIGLPSLLHFDDLQMDEAAVGSARVAAAADPRPPLALVASVPEPIDEPLDVVTAVEGVAEEDPEGEPWCLVPPPVESGTTVAAVADAIGKVEDDRLTLWLDFERMHVARLLPAASVLAEPTAVPARRRRTRTRLAAVAASSRRSGLAQAVAPLAEPRPHPRRQRRPRVRPSQLPASVPSVASPLATPAPPGVLTEAVRSYPQPLRLVAAGHVEAVVRGLQTIALQLPVGAVEGAVALAPLPARSPLPTTGDPLRLLPPSGSREELSGVLGQRPSLELTSNTSAGVAALAASQPTGVLEHVAGRTPALRLVAAPARRRRQQHPAPLALPSLSTGAQAVALAVVERAVLEATTQQPAPADTLMLEAWPVEAPAVEPQVIATPLALVEESSPAAPAIAGDADADVEAEPEVAAEPEVVQAAAAVEEAIAPIDDLPATDARVEGIEAVPEPAATLADAPLFAEPVPEADPEPTDVEPQFVPGEGLVLEVADLDVSGLRVVPAMADAPVAAPMVELEEELTLLEALIREEQDEREARAEGLPAAEDASADIVEKFQEASEIPPESSTLAAPVGPAPLADLTHLSAFAEPDTDADLEQLMAALKEVEDAEEAASGLDVPPPASSFAAEAVLDQPALDAPAESAEGADRSPAATAAVVEPLALGEDTAADQPLQDAEPEPAATPPVEVSVEPDPVPAAELAAEPQPAEPARRRRSRSRGRRRGPVVSMTAPAAPAPQQPQPAGRVDEGRGAERRPTTGSHEAFSVVARRLDEPDTFVTAEAAAQVSADLDATALRPELRLDASPDFEESLPSYAPWLVGAPLPSGAAEASPLAAAQAIPTDTDRISVYSPEPQSVAPPAQAPAMPATPAIRVQPPVASGPAEAPWAVATLSGGREAGTSGLAPGRARAGTSATLDAPEAAAPMFGGMAAPASGRRPWLLVAAVVALLLAAAAGYWWLTPAGSGTLAVEASTLGLEVFVDGHSRGIAPISVELPAGRHAVEVRGHGATRSLQVDVVAGQKTTKHVNWSEGRTTGSLKVTSTPEGAKVRIGGELRGVTPVVIDGLSAGQHAVTVESEDGAVRRQVQVTAGVVGELDVSIFSGWMEVRAPFKMDVLEDGRRLGSSEDGKLMLSPGTHRLELANATYGLVVRRTVEIKPGDTLPLSIEAPMRTIQVSAPDGTQVFVDRELRGTTPLETPLRVPAGTYTVLLSHPTLGPTRSPQVVIVKASGEAARIAF